MFWETLTDLPLENFVVYLVLADAEEDRAKQGYPLVVSWVPGNRLRANQRALSVMRYRVSPNTAPGAHPLRLFVYAIQPARDLEIVTAHDSSTRIEIGTVIVEP